MRRLLFSAIAIGWAAVCFGQVPGIEACGPVDTQALLKSQAQLAVSEDAQQAERRIEALRNSRSSGLETFLAVHKATIDKHLTEGAVGSTEPEWQRVRLALDSIAGQRDCYASKLFWYTDLEQAKAAAKESGKPILSLRLLGKLTDEFSCANSRFFRSTLYANEEVSRALRDRFVLHWQSVRPVPKVTIDFGDGRKLERTLTGNSIHYILDSDGRVIDALPGLYGPTAFLRGLQDAEKVVAAIKPMDDAQRADFLRGYHDGQSRTALQLWQRDLQQLGLLVQNDAAVSNKPATAGATQVRAAAANRVALTKSASETILLVAALPDPNVLANATDDAVWARIAQLHQADAELDDASVAFMRAKNPTAGQAGARTASKMKAEDPMLRLVRAFQSTIAIDTVRNEYTFHRQIHQWFAGGEVPLNVDVNQLNERVYAQLFLTPSNDPWLGLIPGNVYTALDNNGVAQK